MTASVSLSTILIIILIVFMIGGMPQSRMHNAGYWPSGGAGLLLLILIILLLLGRI